jgi:hypothetical protein
LPRARRAFARARISIFLAPVCIDHQEAFQNFIGEARTMKSAIVTAAFSQSQIEALAREWQRELKIQDWDIVVKIVRGKKLCTDDGGITFEEKRREAFIMIRDPRDVAKDRMKAYDMEVVLVHELLHCSLAPFTGALNSHADVIQEQAVHAHSQALVRWKRLSEKGGIAA